MNTEKYIKSGKRTALISFLLGTGIFGLYFLTSASDLLFLGYAFIALTVLINVVVLISILVKATKDIENRKKLFNTCGLMLLNIPVMIVFIWIALILLGNMRITFTNSTQIKLTDINIIGCENEHIDELKPNESRTIWVGITGDCTINIDYLSNGQRKEENVAGYVTSGMGQKMKYNIGGKNKREF